MNLSMNRYTFSNGAYANLSEIIIKVVFAFFLLTFLGFGRITAAQGVDPVQTEACALLERGDPQGAADRLLAAIAEDSDIDPLIGADRWALLARIRETLGDTEGVLEAYRRDLELRRHVLDPKHEDIADTLTAIAFTLRELNRNETALPIFREALDLYRELETEGIDMALALNNLACCLGSLDRDWESIPYFKEAIAICSRLDGTSPYVPRILVNYARALMALDRDNEALALVDRLLEGDLAKSAEGHTGLRAAHSVEMLYWSLERHEDAMRVAKSWINQASNATDHADLAVILNESAFHMWGRGYSEPALPIFKSALAMRQRLHSPSDSRVLQAINNYAHCLYALNRHEDAISQQKEVLKRQAHALPEGATDYANWAANLGEWFRELGQAKRAVEVATEAVSRLEASHSPEGTLWHARASLVAALFEEGNHEEVLRVSRGAPTKPLSQLPVRPLGILHHCRAEVLEELGREEERIEALECAARFFQTAGASKDLAKVLGSLGVAFSESGDFNRARTVLSANLRLRRRLHPEGGEDLALALNNLGQCLWSLSDIGGAMSLFREAIEILEKTAPVSLHLKRMQSNFCSCLLRIGAHEEALVLLESLTQPDKEQAASVRDVDTSVLVNLGYCLGRLGRTDQALAVYRRVQKLMAEDPDRSINDKITLRNNIAHALLDLGRTEEALLAAQETLQMAAAEGYSGVSVEAVRHNLSTAYLRLGNYDDARRGFEQAILFKRNYFPNGHPSLVKSLEELGRVQILTKDFEGAQRTFSEAVESTEGLRRQARFLSSADRTGFINEIGFSDAHALLRTLHVMNGDYHAALSIEERARARRLLDLLESSRFDALEEAERRARERRDESTVKRIVHLREELEKNESETALLIRRLQFHDDEPSRKESLERLNVLNRELRDLRREHAHLAGFVLSTAESLSAERCQAVLREDEALLEYCLDDETGFVFIVERDRLWVKSLETSAPSIAHLVARWRRINLAELNGGRGIAVDRRKETDLRPAECEIGEVLLPPEVWKRIEAKKRVWIIADDALHKIPFEVLIPKGKTKPWIEYGPPLAVAPSASVLARLLGRVREQDVVESKLDLLVVANPVFESIEETEAVALRTSKNWPKLASLPGTHVEARTITGLFEKAGLRQKALLGPDANETRCSELAGRTEILHFATHSIRFAIEGESLHALVLSMPPEESMGDGLLRLEELLLRWRARLSGCRLVVLSACSTNIGEYNEGEVPHALPVGFLFAGAGAVMGTLWPVGDTATAQLMTTFYQELILGGPEADVLDCLFQAKRERIATGAHPRDWAGFVLIGPGR